VNAQNRLTAEITTVAASVPCHGAMDGREAFEISAVVFDTFSSQFEVEGN